MSFSFMNSPLSYLSSTQLFDKNIEVSWDRAASLWTQTWQKLRQQEGVSSHNDVHLHLDAIVFASLAVWFQICSAKGTLARGGKQKNGRRGWKGSPFAFYTTIAFFHPYVQDFLWNKADAMLAQHELPVLAILSSLDLVYFVSTAIWHRFLRNDHYDKGLNETHKHSSFSKQRPPEVDTADPLYERKREMNFKDAKLYDFIDHCQAVKKQLRPVKDPLATRSEKLAKIRQEQRAKAAGPLKLTPGRLQELRAGLNKARSSVSTSEEISQ